MRNRGLNICRSRGRLPLAPSEGGRRGRWRMLKAGRRREKCRDSVLVSVAVLLGPPALVECRKRMRGMCCQCGRCAHATCASVLTPEPTTLSASNNVTQDAGETCCCQVRICACTSKLSTTYTLNHATTT